MRKTKEGLFGSKVSKAYNGWVCENWYLKNRSLTADSVG